MDSGPSGGSIVPEETLAAMFPNDSETPLFFAKFHKVGKVGKPKERIIIVSTSSLYLLDKAKILEKQTLVSLKHIIKSVNAPEVLLYFTNEKDMVLQFTEAQIATFLENIKQQFLILKPAGQLKVFGIPSQEFHKYRAMSGYDNEPDEQFRILNEELGAKPVQAADGDSGSMIEDPGFSSISNDLPSTENVTVDNLLDHVNAIVGGGEDQAVKTASQKKKRRTLTNDETQDLQSTKLMKTRSTIAQKPITFHDFDFKMVLGRGTFGKVFLVEMKTTKKLYAVKSIRKDILIEYDQVDSTMLEKQIMLDVDHSNLINMDYVFQNDYRLYFVMPFIRGGELYKVMKLQKRFTEDVVKFYAAQLVLGIGYLHQMQIIHRDLKLENILLDQEGYIKIIDYGLAKIFDESKLATTFCGTPEYLAPEMVKEEGHDYSVDWWTVGILIYEMLIGITPFFNRQRQRLMQKICGAKVVFPDRTKYKIDYSDELVDIVNKLLMKDRRQRLGTQGGKDGFTDILQHPWFAGLDIKAIETRQMKPPFMPNFGTQDLSELFNVQQNAQAMKDTFIPKTNKKVVDQNQDAFAGFNTK